MAPVRRAANRGSRRAGLPSVVTSRSPGPARARLEPIEVEEPPHAHIVCRICGRIQRVELTELDRHLLTELAALRPDGWSVERIAYSLTGACRRCREGPDLS
jgi:hypothetical protein